MELAHGRAVCPRARARWQREMFVDGCPKKGTKEKFGYDVVSTDAIGDNAACMVCLDCLEASRDFPGIAQVGQEGRSKG